MLKYNCKSLPPSKISWTLTSICAIWPERDNFQSVNHENSEELPRT